MLLRRVGLIAVLSVVLFAPTHAAAQDSRAMRSVSAANVSGGKEEVSGRPPAREITSGLAVIAIKSRIADERMCVVRLANRPA